MAENDLLRAHVTRVGFNLTLTKTQMAALIQLDVELSDPRSFKERMHDDNAPGELARRPGRHILSNDITPRQALMARGLVSHRMPPRRDDPAWPDHSMRDSWSITPAGRAVICLLKDSGLYEEVSGEIPWQTVPTAEQSGMDYEAEVARLKARAEAAEALNVSLRDDVRTEARRAAQADRARVSAEMKLARLKERVQDIVDIAKLEEAVAA